MTEFRCPRCGYRHTPRNPEVVRVQHNCHPDEPVDMIAVGGDVVFDLYCGNLDCPTRQANRTHRVLADELPDGQVWLCPTCR